MNVRGDFSGRAEEVIDPLAQVGISTTDTNPDVIITDTLSRDVLQTEVPAIYRPRSDVLKLWERKPFGKLRGYLNTILPAHRVAAIVTPDPVIERKYNRITMTPVETIPLPKDASEYRINHQTENGTDLLTLTNLNYERKTDPMLSRVPTVNAWCDENGGSWVICGDGQYADRVSETVQAYEYVFYEGFVDPKEWLLDSDILLHFSELDSQHPNAILEAFCSGLPVITNAYQPFRESAYIQDTRNRSHLKTALTKYSNESKRKHTGWANRQYVERHHDPEIIGQQWKEVLERVA